MGMMKLYLLLYADDVVIFAETPQDLQRSLNILEAYSSRWKLKVNTNKTKIVVFRKGGRLPTSLKFTYMGEVIEIVSKFSYLGVVFTSGGSSFETQKTLSGQALKAIFTLNKYLYHFIGLKPSHVLDLFDKLISPILNYGSEVWGFYDAKAIETVHMQFCKRILGVKQTTQNDFIFGELGRIDYRSVRLINIIKYWLKIIGSDNRKYIKFSYNMMLNDLQRWPNKQNWASFVKDLLSRLGFLEVWLAQGVGDTNVFLSLFKERVKDIFMQEWRSRLENSTRARFYLPISDFQYQKYLDVINTVKLRKSLSKLRVSSHRLEIEMGRWAKPNKIPIQNRKCRTCDMLEDEYHFILECSLYTELRKQYIKRYYWNRPSMFKLIQLFKSKNKKVLRNLSTFIEKAFATRKEIV